MHEVSLNYSLTYPQKSLGASVSQAAQELESAKKTLAETEKKLIASGEATGMHLYVFVECNTLQHTATYCNILQHTATHCNTLQHTSTYCNILQRIATHCNALQRTATHCNALQRTATHCNTQDTN